MKITNHEILIMYLTGVNHFFNIEVDVIAVGWLALSIKELMSHENITKMPVKNEYGKYHEI